MFHSKTVRSHAKRHSSYEKYSVCSSANLVTDLEGLSTTSGLDKNISNSLLIESESLICKIGTLVAL